MSDATDEDERAQWASRRRLVKQQTRALDPTNRTGLIAQQQAWMRQAHDLS
ncbi:MULTISPECIES: hypothetical protein [Micrococcales]|uniref:hypothetical protein n=1 Tax=Micrococcales TaxID=85006 RepID=UPI000050F985|nr:MULTISPECIES: hypothetical protein [Brevibacterium]